MATRPKRPRDVNQLAKLIVDISTGEVEDKPLLKKYPVMPAKASKKTTTFSRKTK